MKRGADSIKRKLTFAIMLTSLTVLIVTGASFVVYELVTFNERLITYMTTLADVVADGVSSALEFEYKKAASETLATLDAEPHIVAAGIYNSNGVLFVWWPTNHPPESLIQRNVTEGFHFEPGIVVGYHPILNREGSRIGTLYLKSDLGARHQRFKSYAGIVAMVFFASLLVASFLASILQKSISRPVLALADTAKAISARRDYSVRAVKSSNDELGTLTDAFNHMLTQIQERDAALSRSEEQFRQLANAVPAIVWTTNAEGSALYFNDQWYEYTGLSPENSLGDKWTQRMHPEDRSACIQSWKEALRTGKPYEDEVRFRGATGEYRWFLNRAEPTRDAAGKITVWFGTSTDIEEKKRTEEKISQMNAELERRVQERTAQLEASNRELEAFSYSVAHDLRSPLRSIDGFNRAFLEEYAEHLPQEGRSLLQRSRAASQRMAQLIDDLLNLSRVARTEMRHQRINLSEIASTIAADLQKSDPERKMEFRIESGIYATGDDRLLRLVLENLLGNSVKFTRHTANPRIEFGSIISDGKRVLFVRDNGAGFNMNYAGKLFGPFQRLHGVTEYPGTGIGLATVHRIIGRHGGTIWPEAEEGKGATFYFTLPK